MTYSSIVDMAYSSSLQNRIQACAAEQNAADPIAWTSTHLWRVAASPGWAAKWDSAKAGLTIDGNPDLGIRDDVITDGDILAAVQAIGTA